MNKVSGSGNYKQDINKYEGQTIISKNIGANISNSDELGEKVPIVVSEANIIMMEMLLREQVLA